MNAPEAGPAVKTAARLSASPSASKASGRTRPSWGLKVRRPTAPRDQGRRSQKVKNRQERRRTEEPVLASRRLMMLAGRHAKGQCQV